MIYEDCDLNYFDSNLSLRPRSSFWFRGELLIMPGRVRTTGLPFAGLRYMKGQGREISHFGLEKGPKGLTDAFYGCEKIEKTF